jgi:arylsulfatase A-like enzyme
MDEAASKPLHLSPKSVDEVTMAVTLTARKKEESHGLLRNAGINVRLVVLFWFAFCLAAYLISQSARVTDGTVSVKVADTPEYYTVAAAAAAAVAADDEPLNVIILYPDDWRHDDIGGLAPEVRTPFLNRLAQEGIRFTHNAVTTSICWISRATLFTGQWVSRHGSTYLFRPKFVSEGYWNRTWPYILQQNGYFVGHIGKWQYQDRLKNLNRLFNWSHFHEGYHWYKEDGKQRQAADFTKNRTLAFLRERPLDTPFALTVAFYPPKAVGSYTEPGAQWSPTNESRALFQNITIPEPYNMTAAWNSLPPFLQHEKSTPRNRWKQRWATPEHYQAGMKNYYALISQVDKACEEIVDELKAQGIYDKTLVIFTTDNGLFHGAHGLAGKWYPFQESIRVPLIIYDPRMPKDKRDTLDDSFTLNVDLAETILGAAGLDPDPSMQGRDISELYLPPKKGKETDPWRDEFYYEYPIGDKETIVRVSALVRKDWKYIYWPHAEYEQLFNLVDDPLELNDLGNVSDHSERLRQMRERHRELELQAMAPCIPKGKCDPLPA